MPVTKDFRTIDEQIAILESRRLKFKNKNHHLQKCAVDMVMISI